MNLVSTVPQSLAGDHPGDGSSDIDESKPKILGMSPGCKRLACPSEEEEVDDLDDSTELTQMGGIDRYSSEDGDFDEYADHEPLDCFDIFERYST